MRLRKRFALIAVLAIIAMMTMTGTQAFAQHEAVLHSFNSANNGAYDPTLNVVFDSAGNLYGTTQYGGITRSGAVYELVRSAGGTWTPKVLYYFNNSLFGQAPLSGVILDRAGNLYGTTFFGGPNVEGNVFELVRGANGVWTENSLHDFGNGTDGSFPLAGLVFDEAGNLYGTTEEGGANGNGTVFELSPQPDGSWTEAVLYSFGASPDAANPGASLIFDSAGNLYGTTLQGGTADGGTVFKLSPSSGGGWTETVLYSFPASSEPWASLVFDRKGNLYGTTGDGGAYGWGSVFELLPQPTGSWSYRVLHNFSGQKDGGNVFSSLIFDQENNLYGAAMSGGAYWSRPSGGYGCVFKMTQGQDGAWSFSALFSFDYKHGGGPAFGGLTFDAAGNLYGAAQTGGTYQNGVVFEITP